jgi:hypothetical protein
MTPLTIHSAVMPGLVPGIHADPLSQCLQARRSGAAWMAGTMPGHDDPEVKA